MKPVPQVVQDSAPEGTVWFGGAVDRVTMSLRVGAKEAEWPEVTRLLGCEPDARRGVWRIEAPARTDGDLDAQLDALLSRVSAGPAAWHSVRTRWHVDIFCGLFLERSNRGISLNPGSLRKLADLGIAIGFDIYGADAPD